MLCYGAPGTRPDRAALCAHCALLLLPLHVVVDLDRVRELDPCDAVAQSLRATIGRILDQRGEPPARRLRLPPQEVHRLAARHDTTRTHLALRLDELGILVAAEAALEQVLGRSHQ